MRGPIPDDHVELIYLREHREHAGWSVVKLARLSGVSARSISRIECGELCTLQTEALLAQAFGLPPLIESPETGLWDSEFCENPEDYEDDERVGRIRTDLEMDV